MKDLRIDNKGNIITSTIAILIVSLILISIFVVVSLQHLNSNNIESISNDNFKSIMEDYDKTIEYCFHDSIEELTDKVVITRNSIHDSPKAVQKLLNKKLDEKNLEFKEKYDVNIESEVLSIEPTDNPSYIEAKIKLQATKDNENFNSILTEKVSIEGFKDPLPFIKCGKSLSFFYTGDRIYYGYSLAEYLKLNGHVETADGYIGASSPLTIKKCPFDPYVHHGDGLTMRKCLDKGYFHESADGSCYLCRLEGKGTCPHYGFEVFICTIPNPEVEISISGSDHVVFSDQYPGFPLEFGLDKRLYLDTSHQKKYGII